MSPSCLPEPHIPRPNEGLFPGQPVEVPADWAMLVFAFGDDTAGVRWYLHVGSGAVLRTQEGESIGCAFYSDPGYVFIERARSREQYRWLERFIASLDDRALATKLAYAISGKQAFQRFKVTLAEHPGMSRRWFDFRHGQLIRHIDRWLAMRNLTVSSPAAPSAAMHEGLSGRDNAARITHAMAGLDAEDLETLLSFAEFLLLSEEHARKARIALAVTEPTSL